MWFCKRSFLLVSLIDVTDLNCMSTRKPCSTTGRPPPPPTGPPAECGTPELGAGGQQQAADGQRATDNMKTSTVLWLHAIVVCYLSGARAQYFHNVSLTFKKMEFDHQVRGMYNMTHCSKSLINCWEILKPDEVCSNAKYYGSVCDLMRDYCSDYHMDSYAYQHMFQMQESYCGTLGLVWGTQVFTRRRAPRRPRLPPFAPPPP